MGAAAYNRGSALISSQIDQAARAGEFVLMEDLNAVPKHPNAAKPFGPIHFVSSHGGWFAECPVTGFGFFYDSLREAVGAWRVTITGYENGMWKAVPGHTSKGPQQ
jgi:hypothetical protein